MHVAFSEKLVVEMCQGRVSDVVEHLHIKARMKGSSSRHSFTKLMSMPTSSVDCSVNAPGADFSERFCFGASAAAWRRAA